MRKFKFGVLALLGLALTFGATSCSDDDPDYSNVTPPTVTVTHSISGRVTGIDGEGLSATVSMNGTSTTTTTDGKFVFENVDAGTYTLTASADGKMSKETTVTVNNGDSNNPVWNITLSNEGKSFIADADGSAGGSVTSETLKGNEEGKIEVTMTAPEEAVNAGEKIIVTPIYSTEEAEQITGRSAGAEAIRAVSTRATGSTLLIGTRISCSDGSGAPKKSITLEYNVDPEMAATITAQKYVNGQWVDAEYMVGEDGKVTVVADRFTSYSLLCIANLTTSVSSETITFSPNGWDNLYGSGEMSVSSTSYSYKIGTDIPSSNSKIMSYLIEIVARVAGAGVTTATGTYPINVTLPVGTAMNISGQQEVITHTASALGISVSGKQYGTVSVITRTWNRQHTGGSNIQG